MKRTALGLVMLMLVPLWAPAQAPTDSWDNLKQLRPGDKIQVVDIHVSTFKGDFVSLTDDAIALRDGPNEFSVARAAVVRVSVRDSSRRKRNMLLGAAIAGGAALGVGLWVYEAQQSGEGTGCGGCVAAIAGGAAGAGAGLGATSTYRTIYRVKR